MPAPIPAADVLVRPGLVRRLLRAQHPDLADLPLRRLGSGWDTVVLRLGGALTVRLPRRELGARLVATEQRWLRVLAPRLPLPTPEPVRLGAPTSEYPYPWSVCRYVPGRPAGADALTGPAGLPAAEVLADLMRSLHVRAPGDAPRNPYRGVPLAERTERLDAALPDLPASLRDPVHRAWQRALGAAAFEGPPRWLHGDLHGLNVLVSRRRIRGVIDFGDLCAGDPATDLASAWLLLDRPARQRLRDLLGTDEAQWERGRGWALYLSVMFLAHSGQSEVNGAIGMRGLAELL